MENRYSQNPDCEAFVLFSPKLESFCHFGGVFAGLAWGMDYRCCSPLMWVHWKGIRVGDVIHFCLWSGKISSEQQPMHDPAKLWINKGTMHSWWHIPACISCIILLQSCKGGFQSLNKSKPLLPPALSCRQHGNEGKIALLKLLQSLDGWKSATQWKP